MKRYVIEKEFEYKGFPCKVVLQIMGHRCGYVNVKGTKFTGMDYNDIPVSVHGGLTYGEGRDSCFYNSDGDYWIGWDYAHAGDAQDWESCLEKFADDEEALACVKRTMGIYEDYPRDGLIYTADDVESDCIYVVEQLIDEGGLHDERNSVD